LKNRGGPGAQVDWTFTQERIAEIEQDAMR
jgi:hypothetical protein